MSSDLKSENVMKDLKRTDIDAIYYNLSQLDIKLNMALDMLDGLLHIEEVTDDT